MTNTPGGVGPASMELPEPKVSPDQCAHALGVFMWDWDKLTLAFEALTEVLIGTDNLRAHIIVESVQSAVVRDMLRDVASHYLNAEQFTELSVLLEEVRKATGVRNRLVHGRWTMVVKVHEGVAVSGEWMRVSIVTDKDTVDAMRNPKHQKSNALKQKHDYSPDAIHAEALKLLSVADMLLKLAATLKVSRNHPPEPRSQRRQGARKAKGRCGR